MSRSNSLVDAIRREHDHLRSRLALLEREIERAHESNLDLANIALLARFFCTFPDEVHHRKEGYVYRALISKGVPESLYLKRLRDEHEEMDRLTAQFAGRLDLLLADHEASFPAVRENIAEYAALQRLHMADEESQFLPLATRELSDAELKEIETAIGKELITDRVKAAFTDLAEIDAAIDARMGRTGRPAQA